MVNQQVVKGCRYQPLSQDTIRQQILDYCQVGCLAWNQISQTLMPILITTGVRGQMRVSTLQAAAPDMFDLYIES